MSILNKKIKKGIQMQSFALKCVRVLENTRKATIKGEN
ncbi:hypothetical protein CUM54_00725 [Enterococcus faecalis]|uniref:Uncharacterized protein n=2 Tax=Enterococcus faecalis TaxID=1351 RepID=Q835N1_ENTFA|nr:hypothetical protein EF_1346 [Enterococcus faecalis V583]AMR94402.1 hypothetical protein A3777_01590 [Enterococcus faecalis]EEI11901.1 hypothetical protein HMPREF0348_1593 [Enterococcus faecalis TX0104]EEI58696.1 hypothetical protein HMPREF0346_0304 [Enterococcus faecalis EnGen0297]EFK78062.1 hypothetical protein HMPREF0347_7536 [Enterococcus faecalis TUSoD Ef11]KAJ60151.1 hypothetical protein P783_1191 [Enterococcus faecalis GA2]KAJ76572.1 hypothetical protein M222_0603 [Enterococcus faec